MDEMLRDAIRSGFLARTRTRTPRSRNPATKISETGPEQPTAASVRSFVVMESLVALPRQDLLQHGRKVPNPVRIQMAPGDVSVRANQHGAPRLQPVGLREPEWVL